MNLQRIPDRDYISTLFACYAEVKDNSLKMEAETIVTNLIRAGNKPFKVEDRTNGVLVGFEVIHEDEVLFSKYRKQI